MPPYAPPDPRLTAPYQRPRYRPLTPAGGPTSIQGGPPSDLPPGTGPQPFTPEGPIVPSGTGTGVAPTPGTSPFVPPVGATPPAPAPTTPATAPPYTPPVYNPAGVDIGDPTDPGRIHDDYAPGAGSARLAKYGTAQDDALASLTGGPNRTALAKQSLADFERQGELGLNQRFRTVGQRAAALGRTGAGMTTNDLTGLQASYERDLAQKRNELAQNVAEGDISDRYRTVGAVAGLRGQEAGLEAGWRGEQRTERGYQQGEAQRTIENRLAQRRAEDEAEQLRIRRALAQGRAGGQVPDTAAWGGL